MRIEVKCLLEKIKKLKEQIGKEKNNSLVKEIKELNEFLIFSEKKTTKFLNDIECDLNSIRKEMAEFLCEDPERFKLEECFRILSSFCQRFKLAIDENERRRENEMKLEARKSNSQLKRWTQSTDSDAFLIEPTSLTPTHSSTSLTNSLNSSLNCDSKAKRRSRRSSQEDELHSGLLEFLKTANDIGSDVPIFGGSFRRMGSGRRSRTSIAITDSDLNNRERSLNDKNKHTIDETEINGDTSSRMRANSEAVTDRNKGKTSMSDGESDEEVNRRKPFDRFSPLRRTLNYKLEKDWRFPKRLENSRLSFRTDLNNNKMNESTKSGTEDEEAKADHCQTDNGSNESQGVGCQPQVRQYWASKQSDCHNSINGSTCMSRPTSLQLPNHKSHQQPTAVISPTKLILDDDKGTVESTELRSPIIALETDRMNRMACLPRRTSMSSPSNATAAAIVTPLQINEKMIEKKALPAPPSKSRLPVRKAPATPVPVHKKGDDNKEPNKTCIPLPSKVLPNRHPIGASNSRNATQTARTYRSPSTVSRTNLTSDKGSVASMKRSAQILRPNRSFMKQTSSSAAKSKNYSRS